MSGNKGKTTVPAKPVTVRDIAHKKLPSERSVKIINEGNNVRPVEPIYQAPVPIPRKK